MLKKILMITVYLFVGWQAKAAITTAPNMTLRGIASEASQPAEEKPTICMMEAGDTKKVKFKGTTYEEAFKAVTNRCFQIRNSAYEARGKGYASQDRQIEFAQACLNSVKCI